MNKLNTILRNINAETTDYFIIKEKIGFVYHDIAKYKNNILNRILLSCMKTRSGKELYLVPEFNNTEGYYYKL